MASKELVVYGASNAAGWSPGHDVDYYVSKLTEASYSKPPFVQETEEEVIIDLSNNPSIKGEEYVINAAIPGCTLPELLEDFEQQVLLKDPAHVFIWGGLNDPVLAISILHPEEGKGNVGGDTTELLHTALAAQPDVDSKIQASADFIVGYIKRMVGAAKENGINPLVGTLPPFASTLTRFEHDPKAPLGRYLITEGKVLIGLVNERLRAMGEVCVIDAYTQVVDATTGLTKPEFSYGVSVPEASGDILHLNSFGHINVATVLCKELKGKAVTIIPPDRTKLEHS